MYRSNIFKRWRKEIYIAPKTGSVEDENYNETTVYGVPTKYRINLQPANANSDLEAFGETSFGMLRAIVPYETFHNKIHEFDVAYVNTTPENEAVNGEKADYRVKSVSEQNLAISIYFEKITK